MHLHPAIQALRSNPASQRRSQQTVAQEIDNWRSDASIRKLGADVLHYGQGASIEDCTELSELLTDQQTALGFAESWAVCLASLLHRFPLGEVPFRFRQSGGFSAIQLFRFGRATLSLAAYERQAKVREPETARFIDVETTELIVSGRARGTLHRCSDLDGSTVVETCAETWETGDRIVVQPGETRQIVAVEGSLLMLQLTRTAIRPIATREYALADSRLLKTASGDKRASSELMALGVLGAMKHEAGLKVMRDIAINTERDPDLRWEAVRQTLALKPDSGIVLLGTLAQSRTDQLSQPADKLRNELRKAHPQLASIHTEAA